MAKEKEVQAEETKKSEITETPEGGVEVELEEQNLPEVPEKPKEEPKEKSKPPEDEASKLRNRVGYQERVISRMQKQLEDITQPPPVETESVPVDEIDKVAQTDWKAGVRMLINQEVNTILEEDRRKIGVTAKIEENSSIMERNSQEALSRHPELNDESSEKTQIWFDTLEKNPRWQTLPEGPLLVMNIMETELRKRGYDVDGTIKAGVESETTRIARASGTNLPSSRPADTTNKVVLTKEQKEFCDTHGIRYNDYARTQKFGGEVT